MAAVDAPDATTLGEARGRVTGVVGLLRRYAGMPIFVTASLLALYAYISGQELDRIEARRIHREFILAKTVEHLELTVAITSFVVLIAVPLGIVLTRPFARRYTPPVIAVANTGQATPSIGVLALFALWAGIGFRWAVAAFVAYAIIPVLRNTMVGLQQVDRSVIEAGRGMGMSKVRVLARIELPLAVPVILAGLRTALVIAVGTAALATFVDAGGLGDIINMGIAMNRVNVTLVGSVVTAALALTVDWVGGIAEDVLRPRGI